MWAGPRDWSWRRWRAGTGRSSNCATWLHKARGMAKDQFRREVEKELTGKETEASELVYFKLYKSQIPVIEQAIETAPSCWVPTNLVATAWR